VTRRISSLPPAIKTALRGVHRLWVAGRPYDEVVAALDAVASMPEASDPEAATMLAWERLDFAARYDPDDEERERVILQAAPALAAVSTRERAWRIRAVCSNRLTLVERHIPPLIAELEDELRQRPDDVGDKTLEALKVSLAYARGEEQEPPLEPSSWTPPPDFKARMKDVRRLMAMRWPYEDVVAALDALAATPSADPTVPLAIAWERFALANVYDRDDAERERVIRETAPVIASVPLQHRASSIASLCSGRLALAERYIPPLVDELEEELRRSPDAEGEQILAGIKRVLERTRVDAGAARP
jgi:hypothetical protein